MSVCQFLMLDRLTGKKRLLLGLFVLLVGDLISIASSELTEYIFKTQKYDKPYFSTYLKSSMFMLYLVGFLCRRSWRLQCRWPSKRYTQDADCSPNLSAPVYVPIRSEDDGYSSIDSDGNDATEVLPQTSMSPTTSRRSVRFNDHTEVRCMNDVDAEEANLARLSYEQFIRKQNERARLRHKFPVPIVCKLAVMFCLLFFLGNFSYQKALSYTEAGIVNAASSSSGFFTLILAAIWSSGPMDKLTLSKLIAVLISVGGTVLVSLSELNLDELKFPAGAVWAIVGAFAYALYLITLKRKVKDDTQLDAPMFFGFVGLFCTLILWPGFFILHYTNWESFALPTWQALIMMLVNGLVGTVIYELLWLWGCFLTSSLIGTLALGLQTPLTLIFDVLIKNVSYNWMFYAGMAPIFLSFVAVTVFSHYDNWDPALLLIKKCCRCCTRALQSAKLKEMEGDQTERLLNKESE